MLVGVAQAGPIMYIEAAPGGGGSGFDYTGHADCEGAWLLYSSGDETGAVTDRCGSLDMAWSGASWVEGSSVPAGTPSGQDSASFDGTVDNWMDIADNAAFESSALTFMCWLYPEAASTDVAFSKSSSDWELRVSSSSYYRGTVSSTAEDGTTVPPTNTWQHIAVRYDQSGTQADSVATEVETFYNGVSDCGGGACSTDTGGLPGTTSVIRLGAQSDGGRAWVGDLMECEFFSSALSDDEIAEIVLCGMDGLADPNNSTGRGSYGGVDCTSNPEAGCCS